MNLKVIGITRELMTSFLKFFIEFIKNDVSKVLRGETCGVLESRSKIEPFYIMPFWR